MRKDGKKTHGPKTPKGNRPKKAVVKDLAVKDPKGVTGGRTILFQRKAGGDPQE